MTVNPRKDRRRDRTRRQLREALFSLMLEKGYESITIEDITEKADLGRTTFYLHYRDKEDLLLGSIEDIAEDLKTKIFKAMQNQISNHSDLRTRLFPGQTGIVMVLKDARENISLYLPILRGEGTPRAPAAIRQIIQQAAHDFFKENLSIDESKIELPIPIEILTNFLSSSLLGMLTWWLENNMPYPAEEMAEIYRKMFFYGVGSLLSSNSGQN